MEDEAHHDHRVDKASGHVVHKDLSVRDMAPCCDFNRLPLAAGLGMWCSWRWGVMLLQHRSDCLSSQCGLQGQQISLATWSVYFGTGGVMTSTVESPPQSDFDSTESPDHTPTSKQPTSCDHE